MVLDSRGKNRQSCHKARPPSRMETKPCEIRSGRATLLPSPQRQKFPATLQIPAISIRLHRRCSTSCLLSNRLGGLLSVRDVAGAFRQVHIHHLPHGGEPENSVADDRRFALLRSIGAGIMAVEEGAIILATAARRLKTA